MRLATLAPIRAAALVGLLALAGPAMGAPPLPDRGPAPELRGIDAWLNGEAVSMADLRGRVVLVNFWTFGCINCVRTLPFVNAWHEKYADRGLVVLGVHTPEFGFEREPDAVRAAIAKRGIRHRVAIDNGRDTWRAWGNRYWPAFYFVDARGRIRHVHFGEGQYERNEQVIQRLLAERAAEEPPS